MTKTIVEFKSVPENYGKEEDGRKPNTIRLVGPTEECFSPLDNRTATHIRIKNTETGEDFLRRITDITFWDNRFIISWKHPEAKP